jgi:EmrB/QacA subfamily drug resistance transporter
MALLDMSVVNVALPAMQTHLHAPISDIQWVVDGYTLCLSAFMLTGGALGDRHGRRRLFLFGLALFTASSALCAASPDIAMLIVGRLLQGAGASTVTPGALSLLAQGFPDPARRARIIGLWGASSALAVVLGPLLGGVLTDADGWRSIFLINVPLGIIALIAGTLGIEESASPEHAAADPFGQVLGVFWLAALTYAVNEAGQDGWTTPRNLALFGAAAAGLVAFIVVERRVERAMLPVSLFTGGRFAVVNFASFVLGFGAYGTFYLLSLYLQEVLGTSAAMTGVKLLPYSAAIAVGSTQAGRITARFGPRGVMTAGYGLVGIGLLGLLSLTPTSGYLRIGILFGVLGLGMGLSIAPTNTAAMNAVQRERSGAAAATVNATRQVGTALGIAVLGSLLNARAQTSVANDLAAAVPSIPAARRGQVAHVVVTQHGVVPPQPSLDIQAVDRFFASGFIDGLHLSVLVAGVATATATLAVFLRLRVRDRSRRAAAPEKPCGADGAVGREIPGGRAHTDGGDGRGRGESHQHEEEHLHPELRDSAGFGHLRQGAAEQ